MWNVSEQRPSDPLVLLRSFRWPDSRLRRQVILFYHKGLGSKPAGDSHDPPLAPIHVPAVPARSLETVACLPKSHLRAHGSLPHWSPPADSPDLSLYVLIQSRTRWHSSCLGFQRLCRFNDQYHLYPCQARDSQSSTAIQL